MTAPHRGQGALLGLALQGAWPGLALQGARPGLALQGPWLAGWGGPGVLLPQGEHSILHKIAAAAATTYFSAAFVLAAAAYEPGWLRAASQPP